MVSADFADGETIAKETARAVRTATLLRRNIANSFLVIVFPSQIATTSMGCQTISGAEATRLRHGMLTRCVSPLIVANRQLPYLNAHSENQENIKSSNAAEQ